ncbi:MAG: CDP-glucose 4,6-dehydratase [Flammeovirgaceae bacterium]
MVNVFGNIFFNKKVVVTGHTGFKGTWLSVWLLQMGAKVYGISKDIPTNPSMFEALQLRDRITHHLQDIRDLSAMRKIFNEVQPEFVFHLAAQPIVSLSYTDPIETITSNVVGTANILEALREVKGNCNAVIITSDKCYDNVEWTWGYRETDALGGKDPYSASKGAAELIIKTYVHSFFSKDNTVNIASVRAGNVIGGGDWAANRIVPDCIKAWVNDTPVLLRSPNATRPWQHVLEPLSGYIRCAQLLASTPDKCHGEAFNFGPAADQNFTVHQLLKKISTHWKFNSKHEHFVLDQDIKFHEAGLLKLNCDKALHALQWKPVLNFDQTATFTALWYSHYYYPDSKNDLFRFTMNQIEEYIHQADIKNLAWVR